MQTTGPKLLTTIYCVDYTIPNVLSMPYYNAQSFEKY